MFTPLELLPELTTPAASFPAPVPPAFPPEPLDLVTAEPVIEDETPTPPLADRL